MKGTLLSDSVLAGPNIHIYIYSGEFIATSHNLGPQKVAKEGTSPFQEDQRIWERQILMRRKFECMEEFVKKQMQTR